ncbi:MAG TPA: aminotransferase class I/II-fold pyridoxal phosphate-dependent enzyme, partial [Puia sp.]|nr:aminotransferase class I/II-fold pyridoxal phosphate-dependent enzyme [Puia sp.]
MLSFQSKLSDTPVTIFTLMSAMAAKAKAINLGQGFPDFPMDEGLIARVHEAMLAGYNQYAPMEGWMPLRETIAEKIGDLYQRTLSPEKEITVTPGGTYAIYTALTVLLQPGDEVIVFEPAYDSYIPNIQVNGAVPVRIPLEYPDYRIDWKKVEAAITEKTRLIMLNSPHNPTGAVLGYEDIEALRRLVKDKNIFIHSDEVYEHIIFDGIPHLSILRFPDLFERSFVSFSFGKVFS